MTHNGNITIDLLGEIQKYLTNVDSFVLTFVSKTFEKSIEKFSEFSSTEINRNWEQFMFEIITKGSVNQLLWANGCPLNEELFDNAGINGNLNMLQYCYDNGFEWI